MRSHQELIQNSCDTGLLFGPYSSAPSILRRARSHLRVGHRSRDTLKKIIRHATTLKADPETYAWRRPWQPQELLAPSCDVVQLLLVCGVVILGLVLYCVLLWDLDFSADLKSGIQRLAMQVVTLDVRSVL